MNKEQLNVKIFLPWGEYREITEPAIGTLDALTMRVRSICEGERPIGMYGGCRVSTADIGDFLRAFRDAVEDALGPDGVGVADHPNGTIVEVHCP